MTTNALLSYLGVALLFAAAVFLGLAISRSRKRNIRDRGSETDLPVQANAALAAQRADLFCGAVLLAVALIAELISVARGGPESGEASGNAPGGALAVALATFACVIVCLVARQRVLAHMRRRLDAQVTQRRE